MLCIALNAIFGIGSVITGFVALTQAGFNHFDSQPTWMLLMFISFGTVSANHFQCYISAQGHGGNGVLRD
jgi:hypothetical protein